MRYGKWLSAILLVCLVTRWVGGCQVRQAIASSVEIRNEADMRKNIGKLVTVEGVPRVNESKDGMEVVLAGQNRPPIVIKRRGDDPVDPVLQQDHTLVLTGVLEVVKEKATEPTPEGENWLSLPQQRFLEKDTDVYYLENWSVVKKKDTRTEGAPKKESDRSPIGSRLNNEEVSLRGIPSS